MKILAKIVFSILSLCALGFCVAFVLDGIASRYRAEAVESRRPIAPVVAAQPSPDEESEAGGGDWKGSLLRMAQRERSFADLILSENIATSQLLLEASLEGIETGSLEDHFVELMARDLEDHRAVDFAGRVLQEIAQRDPELGVSLLNATTVAEKQRLVRSLAVGWVGSDAAGAFSWIESAWIDAGGGFIDRDLQNSLYGQAMDALVSELKDYELAATVLEEVRDPRLKQELIARVARRIVGDGPETALARISEMDSGVFDTAVVDAIAEEWAARDSRSAASWTLENEAEMSSSGVRSIAKHLVLNLENESLDAFHQALRATEKRDSVAAEAARLHARRIPALSADWAIAVEQPGRKQQAVFDALYEIGYDDFGQSIDYIDYVYAYDEDGRAPVLYSTLKDWVDVDLDAVVTYVGSGRAKLSADLSAELLHSIEGRTRG